MKWGIVFASTSFPTPEAAVALGEVAEANGFESLWAPEHIVAPVGEGVTPYGGSLDGKMDRLWRRGGIPDPLVWLSFVAARTSTIKLGTNVIIVPEHEPAHLAKAAATLDVLSGGRVLLGVGVGELPEEYHAVGQSFTNRGKRMDEYLDGMRALWSEEVCTYQGRFVDFRSVRCDPSPVNGTIPLHIGGVSPAAVNRAARVGDGYFPFVRPDEDLDEVLGRVIPAVRERAKELGRTDHIEMTVGGARTVAEAERFARLGVDRLVIAARSKTRSELEDELGTFADEVIAKTTDL